MMYNTMTNAEINERIRELCVILDKGNTDEWDDAYDEYIELNAILDERYREENQEAFDAFYAKHIQGKRREEIDDDTWSAYSDWHKDMYGFRPKFI